jgi:hypothetical protein
MTNTIVNQRDLAPFLDNEIGRTISSKNNSSLNGEEDFVIICDNFIPFGQTQSKNITFQSVPNFHLTSQFLRIFPNGNQVEVKEI